MLFVSVIYESFINDFSKLLEKVQEIFSTIFE